MTRIQRLPSWLTLLLSTVLILAFSVFTGGAGCPPDDDDDNDATGDDDTADDDDDDTADDDDNDTGDDDAVEPFSLEGDVYLIPTYYEQDENEIWVRMELEWTEVNAAGYPYGKIYVGITENFEEAGNPLLHYTAPTVPADPKNDPTHYLFDPATWPLDEVYVMAIADTWYDTIISPWDNMNFHTDAVDTTGEAVLDADIFIDVEHVWNGYGWVIGHHGYGGGGGGGGGTPCPECYWDIDISGDVFLKDSAHVASTGNSLVAVYNNSNEGPYWFTFSGMLDGGAQETRVPWEMNVGAPFTAQIRGAWDWNNNGLFEPGDDWGATVDDLGDQINPWAFSDADISDMDVQVPLDGTNLLLPEPYVTVSGVVMTDGTFEFADLSMDNGLFVGANKNFITPELDPEDLLAQGYLWGYDQIMNIAGAGDSIPYEIWVPRYTTVFLKAGIYPTDLPDPTLYETVPSAVHVMDQDMVRNIEMTYQAP